MATWEDDKEMRAEARWHEAHNRLTALHDRLLGNDPDTHIRNLARQEVNRVIGCFLWAAIIAGGVAWLFKMLQPSWLVGSILLVAGLFIWGITLDWLDSRNPKKRLEKIPLLASDAALLESLASAPSPEAAWVIENSLDEQWIETAGAITVHPDREYAICVKMQHLKPRDRERMVADLIRAAAPALRAAQKLANDTGLDAPHWVDAALQKLS